MFIIEPYLTFDGNCREAFDFYRSVFGGEYRMMTYGEVPEGNAPVPEEYKKRVMHTAFPVGREIVLMGADSFPGAGEVVAGNNVSLTLSMDDEAESRRLYEELSAGGSVKMELQQTFFADLYAMFTDRFGIHWMIVYGAKE